ncbi:GNAT family N-acetyltransferase [Brevibacillus daliensis]|uniref:GNAT family N-acetyltransferase n=1 Tax=Brevibacillus daliensis TaxID=2892995 RepID=UPI004039F3E7
MRFAKEEDLEHILEIYNDAILHTTAVYDYKPTTLENRKQWFLYKHKEGYATLLAGIDSTNEKSIHLHEKLGFPHSGTIRKASIEVFRRS